MYITYYYTIAKNFGNDFVFVDDNVRPHGAEIINNLLVQQEWIESHAQPTVIPLNMSGINYRDSYQDDQMPHRQLTNWQML